ncbi:MAG: DUF5681 domain-containing protein [Leptothrix sp. (in: b-proteobacteria)]
MSATKSTTPPGGWKPGQSGNPAGRKPGTGQVAKLRAAIAADIPGILSVLTAAARSGDVAAARLLLERVLPALKPEEAPLALPLPDGSLSEQGRAVLAAVAAGDVAPGQGANLLAAIARLAHVIEIDELVRRVSALEVQVAQTEDTR